MDNDYKVVKFVDNQFKLNNKLGKDSVWLTLKEISNLFDVSINNVRTHVKNILKDGELDNSTVKEVNNGCKVKTYNLDMIMAIGYRVKSKKGIIFRKWANKILTNILDDETNELKNVIDQYIGALSLLDDYDHQCLSKPEGNKAEYILNYDECRIFINNMKFVNDSNVFGVEKVVGQLEGILASINQTAFGEEVYKSLEEKAANLLYFIVKDHPFVDGCKRIAAGLFLLYLSKNALLSKNKSTISNGALVAITLLVAESKPEEKEIMIRIIMNILFNKM